MINSIDEPALGKKCGRSEGYGAMRKLVMTLGGIESLLAS